MTRNANIPSNPRAAKRVRDVRSSFFRGSRSLCSTKLGSGQRWKKITRLIENLSCEEVVCTTLTLLKVVVGWGSPASLDPRYGSQWLLCWDLPRMYSGVYNSLCPSSERILNVGSSDKPNLSG
jgi:hypothetical protein